MGLGRDIGLGGGILVAILAMGRVKRTRLTGKGRRTKRGRRIVGNRLRVAIRGRVRTIPNIGFFTKHTN
jgi:hypothetical protein